MANTRMWAAGRALLLGIAAWTYSLSGAPVQADDGCYNKCNTSKDIKGNCIATSCDSDGEKGKDTCNVGTCVCTYSGNECGKELEAE